jgi:hypothetical protein
MLRLGSADDGGVHAGHTQGKPQRYTDCFFRVGVAQKIVIQFSQALPILVVIRIDWFVTEFPRCVCNWTFRDHAQVFFPGERHGQVDRFLIGDVDRDLHRVKRATLHRKVGGSAVTTVTDVARMTALARRLQPCDRLALAQLRFRAAVQLDKVESIGF